MSKPVKISKVHCKLSASMSMIILFWCDLQREHWTLPMWPQLNLQYHLTSLLSLLLPFCLLITVIITVCVNLLHHWLNNDWIWHLHGDSRANQTDHSAVAWATAILPSPQPPSSLIAPSANGRSEWCPFEPSTQLPPHKDIVRVGTARTYVCSGHPQLCAPHEHERS